MKYVLSNLGRIVARSFRARVAATSVVIGLAVCAATSFTALSEEPARSGPFDFSNPGDWSWHNDPRPAVAHATRNGLIHQQAYSQNQRPMLVLAYDKTLFRQPQQLRPVGYDREGRRLEFSLETSTSAETVTLETHVLQTGPARWEDLVFVGIEKAGNIRIRADRSEAAFSARPRED